MDRCRYPSKPCLNARAVKLNGELHRFCEQHRRQANQNQMRWSKRKQTVLRVRRGDGEDGDDDEAHASGGPPGPSEGGSVEGPPHGYASRGHPSHLPPPPPQMGMPPHGMNMNVHAAGTSLSHLSLNSHNLAAQPNGGLISSFQDHMARGGAIPGTNGVNIVLSGGAVRRELAPAPPQAPMAAHRGSGGGVHVPPIQTALPPLLPPRAAAAPPSDQPDPSAVHALLMLERAANMVSTTTTSSATPSSSQPVKSDASMTNETDDDDAQVRRELKRAKSNEWIARPTLSPAGLPTVSSLVTHGLPSSTAAASSSSSASAVSVASVGRSASWQVREDPRESLGQWMQRKQASLPSLSNITRIEKRPYDSISSSAPSGSAFLHRGPENSGVHSVNKGSYGNNSTSTAPQHHGPYHVPLHSVSTAKSSTTNSSTDPATDSQSSKRSALV